MKKMTSLFSNRTDSLMPFITAEAYSGVWLCCWWRKFYSCSDCYRLLWSLFSCFNLMTLLWWYLSVHCDDLCHYCSFHYSWPVDTFCCHSTSRYFCIRLTVKCYYILSVLFSPFHCLTCLTLIHWLDKFWSCLSIFILKYCQWNKICHPHAAPHLNGW